MQQKPVHADRYVFEEEHPRPGLREFYAIDPATRRAFMRIECEETEDPADVLDIMFRRVRARLASSALRLVG